MWIGCCGWFILVKICGNCGLDYVLVSVGVVWVMVCWYRLFGMFMYLGCRDCRCVFVLDWWLWVCCGWCVCLLYCLCMCLCCWWLCLLIVCCVCVLYSRLYVCCWLCVFWWMVVWYCVRMVMVWWIGWWYGLCGGFWFGWMFIV